METDFTTFSEIQDERLRVFNRAVMCMNILEDFGKEPFLDYVSNFTSVEKAEILTILQQVKVQGPEGVRKEVMVNSVIPMVVDHDSTVH